MRLEGEDGANHADQLCFVSHVIFLVRCANSQLSSEAVGIVFAVLGLLVKTERA